MNILPNLKAFEYDVAKLVGIEQPKAPGLGDFVVSGAGTADVNGGFLDLAVVDGVSCYAKGTSVNWHLLYLRRNASSHTWEIVDNDTSSDSEVILYTNPSTADTPPSGGWVVSDGVSPAPSKIKADIPPLPSYTILGAGTAEINGDYTALFISDGETAYVRKNNAKGLFLRKRYHWLMIDDPQASYYQSQYYSNSDSSHTPPLTDWIVYNGTDPAPTVAEY